MKANASKLAEAAVVWHAARVLSGARPTKADEWMHKQVAKYLRAQRERKR